MTAAVMIRPGPFVLAPADILAALSKAAARAFDIFWRATGFAERKCDLSDRELAAAMGCSIRTAQRAIHDLENLKVDGQDRPFIERSRQYGPREVAGRRIAIVAPEVVPVAREDPQASRPPPPAPAARARPIPNVGIVPPPTADQLAAGRAASAAGVHRPIVQTPEQLDEQRRRAAAMRAWLRSDPGVDFDAWFAAHPDAGRPVEPKPRC